MAIAQTGNRTHDAAVAVAESTRQVAVASATSQAGVRAAEISFYRTALASAKANGLPTANLITALAELGVLP